MAWIVLYKKRIHIEYLFKSYNIIIIIREENNI